MKILGLIPARGGSKGIPRKNIVDVAGKPLIAYTIGPALASGCFDKIAVSSDDDLILDISRLYGVQSIKRPVELAQDDSRFEDLILHALTVLEEREKYVPEALVYLQPTSPLRTASDIDGAVQMLLKSPVAAVISVRKVEPEYLKTFVLDKRGYLIGAVNNRYPFMNRQDLPDLFLPNGAIYAILRKEFLKRNSLFSPKTLPYVMPEERSFDLNSREDLTKLEKML